MPDRCCHLLSKITGHVGSTNRVMDSSSASRTRFLSGDPQFLRVLRSLAQDLPLTWVLLIPFVHLWRSFSLALASGGPFCLYHKIELATSWISPPGVMKQFQLHTMTTHILAQLRHSPNATAVVGVISYPPALRRMWEPTQGREGHGLGKEKEKSFCAQLYSGSQNLKTCWLYYRNEEETLTGE